MALDANPANLAAAAALSGDDDTVRDPGDGDATRDPASDEARAASNPANPAGAIARGAAKVSPKLAAAAALSGDTVRGLGTGDAVLDPGAGDAERDLASDASRAASNPAAGTIARGAVIAAPNLAAAAALSGDTVRDPASGFLAAEAGEAAGAAGVKLRISIPLFDLPLSLIGK